MAWQTTWFILYNCFNIFDKISTSYINRDTLLNTSIPIRISFFLDQILLILGNIKQINKVEKLISLFCYETLDFPKLTFLYKTLKVSRLTMADSIVLNHTNTEFFVANTRKKQTVQCIVIQYNSQGAYTLNIKNVKKRR